MTYAQSPDSPTRASRVKLGVLLDENKSRFLESVFAQLEIQACFEVIHLDLEVIRQSRRFKLFWLIERIRRSHLADIDRRVEAQSILHICRRLGIERLIAVDNKLQLFKVLLENRRGSGLECFIVQMGSNPVHRERDERQNARKIPITFFSWGFREQDDYVRAGLSPETVVPIGSLKADLARRAGAMNNSIKKWDICLVSAYSSQRREHVSPSPSVRHEQASMPALVSLLRPIIVRNRLKVVIAVKAGQDVITNADEDEEIDFYRTELGELADFSSFQDSYASYSAASASRLLIARNSGLLYEFLDSNSRVLFVNSTDFALFDVPPDVPFGISQPTESELESLILRILSMSESEYQDLVTPIVRRYCLDSSRAIASLASGILARH